MTYLYNQSKWFEQLWYGDHPGIILVKFGQNPMSSFRGKCISENVDKQRITHDHGQRTKTGHNSSP